MNCCHAQVAAFDSQAELLAASTWDKPAYGPQHRGSFPKALAAAMQTFGDFDYTVAQIHAVLSNKARFLASPTVYVQKHIMDGNNPPDPIVLPNLNPEHQMVKKLPPEVLKMAKEMGATFRADGPTTILIKIHVKDDFPSGQEFLKYLSTYSIYRTTWIL